MTSKLDKDYVTQTASIHNDSHTYALSSTGRMFLLLLTFIILLFAWWWKNYAQVPEKFPPGPYGLPLIGYLPLFSAEDILTAFSKLHQVYGSIFSINIGPSKRIVVIGDYETLKEAFKDDSLAARPPETHWFNVYFRFGNGNDSRGLLFSHGSEWSEQRRFSLRSLRDLGFGKSSMEELIREEVLQFCQQLEMELGHPVKLRNKFNISVINALWTLIAGKRYTLDDSVLLELVKRVDELTRDASNTSVLQLFPWMRHVAPELTGWTRTVNTLTNAINFVSETIDQHMSTFQENPDRKDHPTDFIESFLSKIEDSPPESSFYSTLGRQNLQSSILDLLLAGSETTSTGLTWAILFMIRYPEVQKKVQKEIDQVVGEFKLPELSDRSKLPYTEAVVQEILRVSCIAPLGLPHYAQRDVILESSNIKIPAGTTVFSNIFCIVNNPEQFENPELFNPSRFIDGNGGYRKNDHNIVFSIGKRDCLGKSLALTELFLFFAALMQQFSFKWTDEEHLENLSLKPDVGFTRIPPAYEVIITKRKN